MYTNVNGRVVECEHKYVHKRTDSFWKNSGRYDKQYVMIDYYFCEKCLHETETKKMEHVVDGARIPDWAQTITTRAKSE